MLSFEDRYKARRMYKAIDELMRFITVEDPAKITDADYIDAISKATSLFGEIMSAIEPNPIQPQLLRGTDYKHICVSPDGIIWDNFYKHRLKIYKTEKKTPFVIIYIDGKEQKVYINNLVAKAYVPNPNNYKYIGFKDGRYDNVKAENLEWIPEPFEFILPYRKHK